MKVRKKPVVVEATQWFRNGDHPLDETKLLTDPETGDPFLSEGKVVRRFRRPDLKGQEPCGVCQVPYNEHGWIDTLEGGHRVCPGDWIITGVSGEMYPIKDAIFRATYEAVEPVPK